MQNLKINSTSTPYWCVVVPVDAETPYIYKDVKRDYLCYWHGNGWKWHEELLPPGRWEIAGRLKKSEGNKKSLLTHNQITLTADQKAVVVKQIT